jgi:taurine dioxygenase
MVQASLRATELTPTIGAIVHDVDLSGPLNPTDIAEIRRLFLKHQVIFFEDQKLTLQAQRDFAAHFGEPYIHPVYPNDPSVPEIVIFDNHAHNPTDNDSWHTDLTFAEKPLMAGILYARELPPSGGDTLWSNMRAAYMGLSAPFRKFLMGLDAVHDFNRGFSADILPSKNAGEKRYQKARTDHPPVVHPVIRTHPETGEDCLYVNDGFTTRILGLSEYESERLLDLLNQHIQRPEFIVRWKWKQNSVAFWDNRVTQHYAVNDYLPYRRVMHRVAIAGDRPYCCNRSDALVDIH